MTRGLKLAVVQLPLNQRVVSTINESIDGHMKKLLDDVSSSTVQQVEQSIKSLCVLVARTETAEIRSSLMQLRAASKTQPPQLDAVQKAVAAINQGRAKLLQLYSRATNQVRNLWFTACSCLTESTMQPLGQPPASDVIDRRKLDLL